MKFQSIQFTLSDVEIYNKTIPQFYETVAKHIGINDDTVQFDCTRINIAANIQDEIYKAYERQYPDVFANRQSDATCEVTMFLACSGPKVDHSLPKNTVDIQEGFLVKKQSSINLKCVGAIKC